MLILAIESSCDETSAAVVEMSDMRRQILSNTIASQIDIHRRYGGVVPEIASRAHTEVISRITYEALTEAGLCGSGSANPAGVNSYSGALNAIDAVAVTNAPGLIGALLVGVGFAKALAFSHSKPLIAINHIRGHIAASYFAYPDLEPPFLAFVASGGHTSIIDVQSYTDMVEIGHTRDDAVGEAFDKTARALGLPYPGGAEMDRLAAAGNASNIKLPSPAIAGKGLEFSFSGLKTAIVNYVNTARMKNETICREDIAAALTAVICHAVVEKLTLALKTTGRKKLVFAGGVAANTHLRAAIATLCRDMGASFYVPPVSLCGDNAAMIGAQAYYEYIAGNRADTSLNAYASV
ncbi:MAG: tRNA (adenosine(37)-N6)-threonylcarbamoyltransferase complex transferase subunit TsaD [Clostridiales bacterium]|nr:tRNA (adenosine(37)-N6)-threonylcarbamoyltransferase complex transferase subunit TsaD [Clostridiales bacterium]